MIQKMCWRKLFSDPLFKKFSIFSDQSKRSESKILWSLFLLYAQVVGYQNILKLSCRPLAFISYKAFFLKRKRGLELVSLSHFLHDVCRKIFLTLYAINRFIIDRLIEILCNLCVAIVFLGCDVTNLKSAFSI